MLRKANAGRVSAPAEIVAGDWRCGRVEGERSAILRPGAAKCGTERRADGPSPAPRAREMKLSRDFGYKAMRVSIDSCFIFSCGAGPVDARTTNSASTAISGW